MNIDAILGIINKLLTFYDKIIRRKKYEARQQTADQVANDPGAAFADHFGGVHSDDSKSQDASKTSKTDD